MSTEYQGGSNKQLGGESQVTSIAILMMAVCLAVPVPGWSQTVMTAQEHLALAQEYQEKANQERRVLSGYARDRANKGGILSIFSTNNEASHGKVNGWSYDDLIAQKKAEVIELNQLAQMHRHLAKELERK